MDTFNLRSIMKMRGVGNRELSDLSGIPLGTLNKIIYGDTKSPTLDNMSAIAKALNCTLDDFVDSDYVKKQILPTVERDLLCLFSQLNLEGQQKVFEYARDLVASGQYIKNGPDRMVDTESPEVNK